MTDLTEAEKQANGAGCYHDAILEKRLGLLRSGAPITEYDIEQGLDKRLEEGRDVITSNT